MYGTENELIEYIFELSSFEDNGCILWHGPKSGKGYGSVCWNGIQHYVHRLAYKIECPHEELNVIRHTCDTPNCWRVDHLINGTTMENVQDKIIKGRQPRGSAMHNSAFCEADIVAIRASPLNLYQLADLYKVTPSTVHYVRARKTWKHVP